MGDKDLTRIFQLPELKSKVPPVPPTKVVTIKGVNQDGEKSFNQDGKPLPGDGSGSVVTGGAGRMVPVAGVSGAPRSATSGPAEYYGPLAYYFQKPNDPEADDKVGQAKPGAGRNAPKAAAAGPAAAKPKKKL